MERTDKLPPSRGSVDVNFVILQHGKFLQFDWLTAVEFQLNLLACEN